MVHLIHLNLWCVLPLYLLYNVFDRIDKCLWMYCRKGKTSLSCVFIYQSYEHRIIQQYPISKLFHTRK